MISVYLQEFQIQVQEKHFCQATRNNYIIRWHVPLHRQLTSSKIARNKINW